MLRRFLASSNQNKQLPNILANLNPGFEIAGAGGADVFASWVETAGDGTVTNETASVHSGGHACKLTRGTNVIRVDLFVTVIPLRPYTFSFWTRGDGTNAGRYSVNDTVHAQLLVAVTTTGIAGTAYQKKGGITFTPPAGCTQVALQLYSSAVNGSSAYFDDVSLS